MKTHSPAIRSKMGRLSIWLFSTSNQLNAFVFCHSEDKTHTPLQASLEQKSKRENTRAKRTDGLVCQSNLGWIPHLRTAEPDDQNNHPFLQIWAVTHCEQLLPLHDSAQVAKFQFFRPLTHICCSGGGGILDESEQIVSSFSSVRHAEKLQCFPSRRFNYLH